MPDHEELRALCDAAKLIEGEGTVQVVSRVAAAHRLRQLAPEAIPALLDRVAVLEGLVGRAQEVMPDYYVNWHASARAALQGTTDA